MGRKTSPNLPINSRVCSPLSRCSCCLGCSIVPVLLCQQSGEFLCVQCKPPAQDDGRKPALAPQLLERIQLTRILTCVSVLLSFLKQHACASMSACACVQIPHELPLSPVLISLLINANRKKCALKEHSGLATFEQRCDAKSATVMFFFFHVF